MLSEWDNGFSRVMSPQGARYALVDKVRQIRNAISHHDMNLLGNQPRVEDSIKAIADLRAAVVKIDIRQIRSLETIEKPDGKYTRIGYVKRPSPAKQMREWTKSAARNLWQRPVVKTVIIAIAAAVIFNLIISPPISLAGLERL